MQLFYVSEMYAGKPCLNISCSTWYGECIFSQTPYGNSSNNQAQRAVEASVHECTFVLRLWLTFSFCALCCTDLMSPWQKKRSNILCCTVMEVHRYSTQKERKKHCKESVISTDKGSSLYIPIYMHVIYKHISWYIFLDIQHISKPTMSK